LKRISGASVGFSVALTEERSRRLFDLRCSPIQQRFTALRELHDEGIQTYAFIGPILPGVTELPVIFAALEGIVDEVHGETLNTSCGNMPNIQRAVSSFDRRLRSEFDRSIRNRDYWESVKEEFYALAEKHQIDVAGFYHHSADDR
jgi:DNA repair photolyase